MPPPFTVRSGANPGADAGTWDSTGSITLPGNITVAGTATLATLALAAVQALGTLTVSGTTTVADLVASGTLTTTGVGGTILSRCTADVTKNASTVLSDITGMSAALLANATYIFESWLYYQSNPTADLKLGLTVPAGATGVWSTWGVPLSQAPVVNQERINYIDTGAFTVASNVLVGGDDEFTGSVWITARTTGFITTTTAGTIQWQVAQNTSDVSNTILKANSFVRYTRVA
jgi:hypothetical protein